MELSRIAEAECSWLLLTLALPARFERATFRLGGGCSILLSYGSISKIGFILAQIHLYVNKKGKNA